MLNTSVRFCRLGGRVKSIIASKSSCDKTQKSLDLSNRDTLSFGSGFGSGFGSANTDSTVQEKKTSLRFQLILQTMTEILWLWRDRNNLTNTFFVISDQFCPVSWIAIITKKERNYDQQQCSISFIYKKSK